MCVCVFFVCLKIFKKKQNNGFGVDLLWVNHGTAQIAPRLRS